LESHYNKIPPTFKPTPHPRLTPPSLLKRGDQGGSLIFRGTVVGNRLKGVGNNFLAIGNDFLGVVDRFGGVGNGFLGVGNYFLVLGNDFLAAGRRRNGQKDIG
jgi:hypothetical protein